MNMQSDERPGMADMQASPLPPFDELCRVLRALPATGDSGFEGLVAAACSELVGAPFRLVGSGRQFGRDTEAVLDGDAIQFEAKRYDSRLPYAALSTKLNEAIDRAGRRVEVWGLAATVALDAVDAEDLRALGDRSGVTVLLLDWAQPLPPLAVLLAAARESTFDWFNRNALDATSQISLALDAVHAHPLYTAREHFLRVELDRSTLGLTRARRRNAEWLLRRFRDRILALHEFNQPLAPLDPSLRPPALERVSLEAQVRMAIDAWTGATDVVVLTGVVSAGGHGLEGDEGVGKSWAAVRSWLSLNDSPTDPRPLLLFMASHMWLDGDEQRPMRLLARLLMLQTGSAPDSSENVERWEARLARWLERPASTTNARPALIVVLDGVNERGQLPWPTLIAALVDLAREKSLRIVVTTRRGVYERDLTPLLRGFSVTEVPVEAFSDADLDAILNAYGRDPRSVQEPLRTFLRNPRVLSVGLELLDRLDPEEVGVERLLFEYLRKRQEERARHASHTPEQLAQTLVRHAREIRARLLDEEGITRATTFDEATLRQRLGVPSTRGPLIHDLQDIIDSQFLRITDARRNRYAFTTQALPLGLALLIVDELDQAERTDETGLDNLLETIIDPIRAIDATSGMLLAALELALADTGIADEAGSKLLHKLLTMQNVPEVQRPRIFSGLRDRTHIYITVTERLYGDSTNFGRRDWMVDALVANRFEPQIRELLDAAARRWLRLWQPIPVEPDLSHYSTEQAEQARTSHEEAAQRHREALAGLTENERAFVDRELLLLPPGRVQGVDEVAITLLAGRPLLAFAADLFAWCVATAAGWRGGAYEQMHWLRQFALSDWEASTAAIERFVDMFPVDQGSETFHWAIQYALSGSGDPEQARRADDTWPLLHDGPRRTTTHAADNFCDVDPLDIDAPEPTMDLSLAQERYRSWCTEQDNRPAQALFRHSGTMFADVRLILCRYRPETAVDCHRLLAGRAPVTDASPTILAQFIAQDAAILGVAEIEPLVPWFETLCARPDLPRTEVDAPVLLLGAILPHVDSAHQLEMVIGLRDDTRDYYWLGSSLSPLPGDFLRARLDEALNGTPNQLHLALFFAAETEAAVEIVRPAITAAWGSDDPKTRGAALRTIVRVGDDQAPADIAASDWAWSKTSTLTRIAEDFCGSVCLLRALVGSDDPNLLLRLHPALWSRAVEAGEGRLAEAFGERLLESVVVPGPSAMPPTGMAVTTVRTDDVSIRRDELTGVEHVIGFSTDTEFHIADRSARRQLGMSDYHAFEQAQIDAGRETLLHPASSAALDRISSTAPQMFARLLDHVEAMTETDSLRAAAVLACDIARIVSMTDPFRASALFARFEGVIPFLPEVMATSHLPRTTLLLWRAADSPEILALRERRLDTAVNDAALAFEVLAAEMTGKHAQIQAYVMNRMTSPYPAVLARAVTIAGFVASDPILASIFEDTRLRHGFLANVAAAAKRSYDRAKWAEHWYQAALGSNAGIDIWRFSELAFASADARCVLWTENGHGSPLFESLRPLMRATLRRAADNATRRRRGELFGERAPPEIFLRPVEE